MKRTFLFFPILLIYLAQPIFSQSVKGLDQAAKGNSGRSTGNSGSSSGYSGSGGGDVGSSLNGVLFFFQTFVYMAQGFALLGKEEIRLAKRNRTENNLFSAEANIQGGYGFTDFTKLQAQGRLHLGWLSLDLRQTILNDRTTEFKTLDFMAWFNLANHRNFKLRAGMGNMSLQNTGDSYFLYGAGVEVLPTDKIRIELFGTLTQRFTSSEMRPRQDINLRVHYDFWKKGYAKASFFGGVSSQKYFQDHTLTTVDAGVNFMLSFHRFNTTPVQE